MFLETKPESDQIQIETNHQFRKYAEIWKRLVASFANLSDMSYTLVSCRTLNVCRNNSTKLQLYEEFEYNIDFAERFRNTTLRNKS